MARSGWKERGTPMCLWRGKSVNPTPGAAGRLICCTLLAAALPLAAQDLVIPVKVNLVHIIATVKNRAGQLVGSLGKDDFQVFDNGVR